MPALLGTIAVWVGGLAAVLLIVRGVQATRHPDGRSELLGPARLLMGGAIVAMLALELSLMANDFTLAYTANHSARSTPFIFKIATAWAALEGSIVLWGLILAVYTFLVARRNRPTGDRLGAGALVVMGVVSLFFFGLMATISNPFEVCVQAVERGCTASSALPWAAAQAPVDGPGPNPLLQNHILMAIHPPMLYLGYIGLTVPFAHAISALALAVPGPEWLARSRRSTLVAWSFLTLGIVLGGWWAYQVLSWGGYWGWDPVENASFMPWLVATAFLHSSLVQTRRGMLQAWNFVLVISAFSLTILGTFLTRSGTVLSVHSFTQSLIGPVLLAFLVFVLVASFGLFATRSHLVASAPRMEAASSREGAFLFNNLLLTVYALVVLVGTIYPMLMSAFRGTDLSVQGPFFVRFAVPISFGLLLAMGIGPVMPWRYARPGLVWNRIRLPLRIALVAGAVSAVAISRLGYVVGAVTAGTFVVAGSLTHLVRSAARPGRFTWAGLLRVVKKDPGYWSGQLSHAGVALAAVGIALASNLAAHTEATFEPGETISFAGYQLTYQTGFQRREDSKLVVGATVSVTRDGRPVTTLTPAINQFEGRATAVPTPAVHTAFGGDLYLMPVRIDGAGATLRLDTSPGQWLLWVGGLMAAGAGFAGVASKRRRAVEELSRV